MVLEVGSRGLTVSLPQGLRGSVPPDQVSDVYAQLVDPTSKAGAALRKALPGGAVPDHTQLFHPGGCRAAG